MMSLSAALEAWRSIVGADHVFDSGERLTQAQRATFASSQGALAVVRPRSSPEVQECVRVAASHRVPLYPVSRGKNWGLGSRLPARADCVLLDLGRLDRIIEFDDKLGYLTVEPGVTFAQGSEFLRAREARHYLSTIGGAKDASLLANALERGDGSGPCGDRAAFIGGLEVVLPDGEMLHSGFERFGDASCARLHRFGVGPSLDGLFMQSNLGIVTRATVWLARRPAPGTMATSPLTSIGLSVRLRLVRSIASTPRKTGTGIDWSAATAARIPNCPEVSPLGASAASKVRVIAREARRTP